MLYSVNLEEMEERWIAHAVALPGCYSSADTREAALVRAAPAITDYLAWLKAHGETPPEGPIATEVDEVIRAWSSAPDYEVNAFFASDRLSLTQDEIGRALQWLGWTRADLLTAVEGLSNVDLERSIEGEWSILGILNHVGRAECWYMDRLDLAFPRGDLPPDVFDRLEKIRSHFRATLPTLAGDERLTEKNGEHWSPRKMLRRALWHERDHTDHIHQFRARLG